MTCLGERGLPHKGEYRHTHYERKAALSCNRKHVLLLFSTDTPCGLKLSRA